jgi:hypothetical protein
VQLEPREPRASSIEGFIVNTPHLGEKIILGLRFLLFALATSVAVIVTVYEGDS